MARRERGAASRAAGARPAPRVADLPGPSPALLRARAHSVAEPVVAAAGLDLDELTVTRAGRRFVVRVVVDADGGVDHNDLSQVAQELSAALDAAESNGQDLGPDPYTLEVSSPGVDRPLTRPAHWRRNVGRLVSVRAAGRALTARVATVDDTGVTFEGGSSLAFADLGPGHVQVEFTRLAELSEDGADEGLPTDGDSPDDGDLGGPAEVAATGGADHTEEVRG